MGSTSLTHPTSAGLYRNDLELTLRRSDTSDLHVLIDFLREVDRIESLRGNTRLGQFITEETTALLESCVSFLAIIQSDVIGAASILVQCPPDTDKKYGHIYLLAVNENWRHRGIGSRLLQTALSWLKDEKISEVTLTVKAANDGAIRLYRSFGFDPIALTMHHKIDPESP